MAFSHKVSEPALFPFNFAMLLSDRLSGHLLTTSKLKAPEQAGCL